MVLRCADYTTANGRADAVLRHRAERRDHLSSVVPLALVTLRFDPTVRAGPLAIRWETLGLAAALFVALVTAAAFVRRSGRAAHLARLRPDDLFYLVLAAVPGAVVGGRLLVALDYLSYYRDHPAALLDPAQGSLSLLGAVLGGTLSAASMCRLLEIPTRRWLDALAVPLLVAIGLGKLAYLLGGGGQGLPFGGPWALAFAGAGPWLSPAAAMPAHPSQVYEALWACGGVLLVLGLRTEQVTARLPGGLRQAGGWLAMRRARGLETAPDQLRFGYGFLAALVWWLAGRVVVGFTWRAEAAVGPLNVEQVAALVVLVALLAAIAWWARPGRFAGAAWPAGAAASAAPAAPDTPAGGSAAAAADPFRARETDPPSDARSRYR